MDPNCADFPVYGAVKAHAHTRVPIRTAQFPSNWELSSVRAINVVRYLVEAGVPQAEIDAVASASAVESFAPPAPSECCLVGGGSTCSCAHLHALPGFLRLLAWN